MLSSQIGLQGREQSPMQTSDFGLTLEKFKTASMKPKYVKGIRRTAMRGLPAALLATVVGSVDSIAAAGGGVLYTVDHMIEFLVGFSK